MPENCFVFRVFLGRGCFATVVRDVFARDTSFRFSFHSRFYFMVSEMPMVNPVFHGACPHPGPVPVGCWRTRRGRAGRCGTPLPGRPVWRGPSAGHSLRGPPPHPIPAAEDYFFQHGSAERNIVFLQPEICFGNIRGKKKWGIFFFFGSSFSCVWFFLATSFFIIICAVT